VLASPFNFFPDCAQNVVFPPQVRCPGVILSRGRFLAPGHATDLMFARTGVSGRSHQTNSETERFLPIASPTNSRPNRVSPLLPPKAKTFRFHLLLLLAKSRSFSLLPVVRLLRLCGRLISVRRNPASLLLGVFPRFFRNSR